MNYTKGEWKANRHGVFVECRNLIIANIVNRETNDETIGNAHLISAAPEMYEALKTVREQVANFLYPKVKLLSSKELIVLMDKALAKAEDSHNH